MWRESSFKSSILSLFPIKCATNKTSKNETLIKFGIITVDIWPRDELPKAHISTNVQHISQEVQHILKPRRTISTTVLG